MIPIKSLRFLLDLPNCFPPKPSLFPPPLFCPVQSIPILCHHTCCHFTCFPNWPIMRRPAHKDIRCYRTALLQGAGVERQVVGNVQNRRKILTQGKGAKFSFGPSLFFFRKVGSGPILSLAKKTCNFHKKPTPYSVPLMIGQTDRWLVPEEPWKVHHGYQN